MFLKKIVKSISFLWHLPKTLYVNFRALPFSQAKHLPIHCCSRVSIMGLQRNSIVIKSSVHNGMISIGLDALSGSPLGSRKHKQSVFRFSPGSKIIFVNGGGFASGNTVLLGKGAQLILGNDFSTNVLCNFFVTKKIVFGDDCFCGWNVSVRDGDGHYITDYETGEKLNPPEEIVIGSHCWLCSDSTVMKGVTVADDCVVACNSLVTKPCTESHAIYGGSPAKLIKRNVSFIRDGRNYGCQEMEAEMAKNSNT